MSTSRHDAEEILQPYRAAADRVMLATLAFLVAVSLGVAAFTDTWAITIAVSLPALLVPAAIYKLAPGSLASRIGFAFALMVFSALTIQQTRGVIEAHFGIFVLLAFLLYYRDWRPVLAAAGLIAVHHVGFNYLQAAGLGFYVFEGGAAFKLVLIHAAYVVVEAAVLIYMALKLERETLEAAGVASMATRIGAGDLTANLERSGHSELLDSVEHMRQNLRSTLGQVGQGAGSVGDSGAVLGNLSTQLDELTRQQRTATTDMARAIEELTESMNVLAEETESARTMAVASGNASREGGRVVKASIDEMLGIQTTIRASSENVEHLGSQSDRVAQVVGLIKDIAGQTNLLALNAAIEAARAGEQGRGFAVVADEVRKLAERTATATEEITSMIDDIQTSKDAALQSIAHAVERVTRGGELATDASTSIARITGEAEAVERVIAGIADALQNQSRSARQIAQTIEGIAAMSERSSGSSDELRREVSSLENASTTLATAVGRFRL